MQPQREADTISRTQMREALPVVTEAELVALAARGGTHLEIECLREPEGVRLMHGEWGMNIVTAGGERFVLVTNRFVLKVYRSGEGMISFAKRKLDLGQISIPLKAGSRTLNRVEAPADAISDPVPDPVPEPVPDATPRDRASGQRWPDLSRLGIGALRQGWSDTGTAP